MLQLRGPSGSKRRRVPVALVLVALFVILVFALWTIVVLVLVGRRVPTFLLALASSAFGSFVALVPFFPTYLTSRVPDESEER
jgi:hypothetical protein